MTTRFIAMKSIVIPTNRQRRHFDLGELNELGESIQKFGLMHPIVLRVDGEEYKLVAGERRYRAIQDVYALGGSFDFNGDRVPQDMIPYTILGELSVDEYVEAELEENIRRIDLSWQERCQAVADLAKLRSVQAEARGLPPPTTKDIAVEVRGTDAPAAQTTTRSELIVARHLDDPDVAKAKSTADALKILKRKEEIKRNAELASRIGPQMSSHSHTLAHRDVFEWVKEQADAQFDVILTDPPYGMGADEFGDSGGDHGAHFYEDTEEFALRCYTLVAQEGFRLTKPDAHLYAFCDVEKFVALKAIFAAAGWKVFRTPFIWYKRTAFRAPWPEYGPQRKYECLLYAMKGDRKVIQLAPDVLDYPPDENLGHNAQKPVALYTDLLKRSVRPGDKVLDFFCGTGPIFPAAHSLAASATGVETDPAAYGIAAQRLQLLTKLA